jgi:hypothetical protein
VLVLVQAQALVQVLVQALVQALAKCGQSLLQICRHPIIQFQRLILD